MKIKKLLSLILSLAISAAIIPVIPAHAETEAANIATHGGGLAPVTAEEREYVQEHQVETEIRLFSTLPSSVDNSATKYFPAIGNQGSYAGSCAAWATTYYQLSYTIAKALDADASSYTFAPNWTYSLSNDGKNEGSLPSQAYKVMNAFGAAKTSEFTGDITSPETNVNVWKSAMKYSFKRNDKISTSAYSSADTASFIEEAKTQLSNGKILTTATDSDKWYIGTAKNGSSSEKCILYLDPRKSEGYHAVTIVGYDDDITYTINGTTLKGAFKMANSWGSSWANNGYVWIAYDAFNKNSSYRTSSTNGLGFSSSWYDADGGKSVFYTIDVTSGYKEYTPSYIGEITFSSKVINNAKLLYSTTTWNDTATSIGKNTNITLFDMSEADVSDTAAYTGTIAFDASAMANYIEDGNSLYEINLYNVTTANLGITNSKNAYVLNTTAGSKWTKPSHNHAYETSNYAVKDANTWTATNTCKICGETAATEGARIPVDLMWENTETRVYDGKASNVTATASKDGNRFTVTVTNGTNKNAGTHTATATAITSSSATAPMYKLPDNNTVNYTITKADAAITTAPTARSLTADGSYQTLVSGTAKANGGTVYYKLATNNDWDTSSPMAINPGTYTVEYYVKGDSNHNDSPVYSIEATIKRGNPINVTFVNPNKTEYYKGETEIDLTGLKAIETYIDGSTETIEYNDTDFTAPASISSSTTKINITYANKWSYSIPITRLDNVLTGITLDTSQVSKTTYYVGENFKASEIKVICHYNYGSDTKFYLSSSLVTGFDSSTPGTKTLTVNYQGFTDTFEVNVIEKYFTNYAVYSAKTTYTEGTEFDYSSIKIRGFYNTGGYTDVDASTFESITSNFRSDIVGPTSCTITLTAYDGTTYTSNLNITIVERQLTSIDFVPPTNRVYLVNQVNATVDPEGMQFIKYYNNGDVETVNGGDADYRIESFPSLGNEGTKTIYINYNDKQFSYTIDVVADYITNIELTTCNEGTPITTYCIGQAFDPYGLELDITYASGNTSYASGSAAINHLSYTLEGFDNNTLGTKEVRLVYGGCKTEPFELTVVEPVPGGSGFIKKPDKLTYYVGESVDLTGATLYAEWEWQVRNTAWRPIPYSTVNEVEYEYGSFTYTLNEADSANADFTVFFDSSKAGTSKLGIRYNNNDTTVPEYQFRHGTAYIDVEILEPYVTSIELSNTPEISYQNTDLDMSNATITETYNTGIVKTISASDAAFELDYDSTKLGKQTVTMNYKGYTEGNTVTATFDVDVLAPYVTSISVSNPDKTEYYQNYDNLDLTGAIITEYYNTGATKTIDAKSANVTTDFDNSIIGAKTVTLTYGEFTATFDVTILAPYVTAISITAPSKTEYYQNYEYLDLTGSIITEYYNTEITKEIDANTTSLSTDFANDTVGNETVTVTYNGFTATFDVTILAPYVTGIVIEGPDKTEYYQDTELDTTGLAIYEITNTELKNVVDMTTANYTTDFDSSTIGAQTVTLTYGNFTATFDVTIIEPYVVDISVIAPTKTAYQTADDELDFNGLEIYNILNTGKSVPVDMKTAEYSTNIEYNGTDKKTVTVNYNGYSKTFDVAIIEYLVNVTISAPTKTKYPKTVPTIPLDLTGSIVTEYYSTGKTIEINAIDADVTVIGFDSAGIPNPLDPSSGKIAGKETVTLTYKDYSTDITIEIDNHALVRVFVETMPEKLTYYINASNDDIDLTGLKLTGEYTDQKTNDQTKLIATKYTVAIDSSKIGPSAITLDWSAKNIHVEIPVEILAPYITGITIVPPAKTEYYQNENLDATGLAIIENTNIGTTNDVDMETAEYTTDFASTELGNHTVNVYYGEFIGTFDVNIIPVPATPTPEPTATPTPEPTEEPTPEPTDEPEITPTPAPTDEPTPTPDVEITPTPEPTDEPIVTPIPDVTDEPIVTPTPEATEEPAETEEPIETEVPTETEEPIETPEPTETPEPIDYDIFATVEYDDTIGAYVYTVDNNTDAKAMAIIAVYDENGVLKSLETVDLDEYTNATNELKYQPNYGDTIKLMVWEGFATMRPVANTVEYFCKT